ncbi:MAG: adenylate kinase family protein [Haloferacaceae archaeon]
MTARVALTGTPGTGKTTVARRLADEVDVVHLNEVVENEGFWTERDAERDSLVADLDAVEAWLDERDAGDTTLVESHLAHLLPADRVVVLRCHPDELEERLRDRAESTSTVAENAESEALDVVLTEAVEHHGRDAVHEIDTTDRDPAVVADDVRAVLAGEREPTVGVVDFTDYL